MANIEIVDLSEAIKKADSANGEQIGGGEGELQSKTSAAGSEAQTEDASSVSASPASALTPLRASPANGLPSSGSPAPTSSAPHPKKFSHSNINKKFLEKTSSTSPSSQTSAASAATKTGTAAQKPTVQTAPSYSRLVTAKLTATLQSTTTGPGWSRPPSSAAPIPSSATNPKPSPAASPAPGQAAPQPAPVGKVIQPQPRGASEAFAGAIKRESPNRPVWGNATAPAPIVSRLDAVASDFPTAAEVAQNRNSKMLEKKQAAQAAAEHKQVVTAEEDTFRGVHLNPNAHHWDEMEEDDDNFLDGVIEFGDGRQYKIQPSAPQQGSPPRDTRDLAVSGEPETAKQSEAGPLLDQPVSKEERFADDFDRSWPRSRNAGGFSHSQRDYPPNSGPSSASSPSVPSPQESSRVLFNERLNRLEPYSSTHPPHRQNGPGSSSNFNRRGSRSDFVASPTELKGGRDAPPHVHQGGVQLLQKTPGFGNNRSDTQPRFMGEQSGPPGTQHDSSRFRDREPFRRDSAMPPPLLTRTPSHGPPGRPRDLHVSFGMSGPPSAGPGRDFDDRPRRANTGPLPQPPAPPHEAGDGARQLPPHLSSLRPPHPAAPHLSSPTDTRTPIRMSTEPEPPSAHVVPQPAASEQAPVSPVPSEQAAGSVVDFDEVQKREMQSAAERARLRRQQEEEEREREKERARKKAAELEARMKSKEQPKEPPKSPLQERDTEAQVRKFIEEAVQLGQSSSAVATGPEPASAEPTQPPSSHQQAFARPPSLRGVPRPPSVRRTSFPASGVGPEVPSPAEEAESWRSRAPRRPSTVRKESLPQTTPLLPPPPPSQLFAGAEPIDFEPGEDLEVIDFSEMGRLVGAHPGSESAESHKQTSPTVSSRPPRAVAADFLGDDAALGPSHPSRTDEGSWRRKPPIQPESAREGPEPGAPAVTKDTLSVQTMTAAPVATSPVANSHPLPSPHQHRYGDESSRPHVAPGHSHPAPHHHPHAPQRSPLISSYREAPMSTLDDTLSRIKGVLDDMHIKVEPPKPEPPKPQKWLPPALRQKQSGYEMSAPSEVFAVTGIEPPRSPGPVWNVFTVKLPPVQPTLPPLPPRQFHLPRWYYARSEIFSWRLHQGASTLDDYLFRRPFSKGSQKYRVSLPRRALRPIVEESTGPVVNLPVRSPTGRASEMRENGSAASWRRPLPLASPKAHRAQDTQEQLPLETVSRSPPPEAPNQSNAATLPKSEVTTSRTVADPIAKSRAQPKMPVGSDVAFYRNARVDNATQPKITVNFTVSSELEDEQPSESSAIASQSISATTHQGGTATLPTCDTVTVAEHSTELAAPAPIISVDVAKTSDQPDRNAASPPPVPGSSWNRFSVKESPSRAPDPEHLKALWSQTSGQAKLPSVNSLEGIGDDLTSVPFTLQEVKSEDGETPPPSGNGPPSRMSLHDVTRAFQQVPTSNAESSHAATMLPPPLTSPPPNNAGSRPNFGYAPSVPTSNMRPAYAYPSPMLSHAPSPTMMYPHMAPSPVPRPIIMNGPPSPYTQPMWMPLPGPSPQPPAAMMRPMASPYATQLVPYPSPGAMPVYGPPPGMQTAPAHATNGVQGRPTTMPMMSPVMQATHPNHAMYPGSPVMMHSPGLLPAQPAHSYPTAPGRGQPRGSYDHPSAPQSTGHSAPQLGPYPIAPNAYARHAW
ncbi:hypothetical protein WOLCODRAFT_147494 [Wolfiporia cocos MD-104 SS10]|uniref:Uncharacterized protein n=1 Tax=Wolfiporia cocos (strain MD-104) TaxID=742152 RepID=A0A2H3J9Q8_WOLCO|nr:hypothetical protein WOLCODRAFT_147494 [Wolfiporia cocos MD-104 SS10]